jgi:5-oxoprolinase (ATP-hydrolysing)
VNEAGGAGSAPPAEQRPQFWIDRGGTFTDCILYDPERQRLKSLKLLSSDRAPIEGLRRLLGLDAGTPLPAVDVRMGTTVGTNALLERKGRECALLITRGFSDLLEIGTQARPRLFDLDIEKPGVLYSAVVEVDARCDADGNVLCRPDPDRVRADLRAVLARGIDSLAVVVLHAYRAPELERELGTIAGELGFGHLALSHEIAAELGLLSRADTTVLDAYLTPLIQSYLSTLSEGLSPNTFYVMQSSGGLADAAAVRGPHTVLSGPAGGVVACANVAKSAGFEQAIGFDMGGTSTDVTRFCGDAERVYESEIAGVRLRVPMLSLHTVAAGGGSLCRYDGHRFAVGPESAGASPGPLSYGNPAASELTLTDVNLLLGRLPVDRFPFPLDEERPRHALESVARRLRRRGDARSAEQVAAGFLRIANHNMAQAIRAVSTARGYDVREHALVVFGGAGGQHACALARLLGIRNVVLHPLAGVLSAYGMGLADVAWHRGEDAGRVELDQGVVAFARERGARLMAEGRAALRAQGFDAADLTAELLAGLRYRGTDTVLAMPLDDASALARAFHADHQRRYGYRREAEPVELVELHAWVRGALPTPPLVLDAPDEPGRPLYETRVWFDDRFCDGVPIYARESLAVSQRVPGPAVIVEDTGALVVEPGFLVERRPDAILLVTQKPSAARGADATPAASGRDPVLLEVMANHYMTIAERMGHVLRRTAVSTNIRERLDFSCAVFDRSGGLVANAPHIPVHLGAMGETVRAVRQAHPAMQPGDVFASNDPLAGGSHLPDITVVTPVFDGRGVLCFYAACRGHHADVGGTTPGSMPPDSRLASEEGVVLRALHVVRDGVFDRECVLAALTAGPYPARNPDHNLLDLQAQIAANRLGWELLLRLVESYGTARVEAYMQHVQDYAADLVREEIARLGDDERRFVDRLDDGTPIAVRLTPQEGRLLIDFTGSGAQSDGNLNAPRAVTLAAVLYFLRVLCRREIPLNSGCLRFVDVNIPHPSILSPEPGRAVAGGNVETSQRVVDVLLGAAGLCAASQGTMNNLTFGNASFGYYETIAGGAGASGARNGASAVHTHMTNTRITDPEVLESRFPVRLLEFSVRRGSGGAGRFRGGDGVCRELEFLEPAHLSVLSQRRATAPFGLHGGAPGLPGRNLIDGRDVQGLVSSDVPAGTRLRIETPGGGGYGAPE